MAGAVAEIDGWVRKRERDVDMGMLTRLLEIARDELELEGLSEIGRDVIEDLLLDIVPDVAPVAPEQAPVLIMAMTTVVDFLDEENRLARRAVNRARGELARAAEALPDALAEANADPTEVLAQLARVGAPADLLEVAAEILGLEDLDDRAEPVDADPVPFPAIRLPALDEVAAAARRSRPLADARRLAEWVGWERPLTATGVLRRADAKAAVAALGLVPDDDPRVKGMKSARDVAELHRLWLIAERLNWLQLAGAGTTVKVVGVPGSPTHDDQAVSDWYDAMCLILEAESEFPFTSSRLGLPWSLKLPQVLCWLYVAFAEDEAITIEFLPRMLSEHLTGQPWRLTPPFIADDVTEFVGTAIDILEQFGALARDNDTVALTPLGAFGFRFWLVNAGHDAPVVAAP